MTELPDIPFRTGCGIAMAEGDMRVVSASDGEHSQWFVERGRLEFTAGGERMVAEEGEMVWRLPHARVEAVNGSEELLVSVVEFTTEELRDAFGGSLPRELIDHAKEEPIFEAATAAGPLTELRRVVEQPGRLYYSTRVRAALALLESELAQGEAPARREPGMIERRHFSRFERLVAQQVMEQHSVGWYAARLCLSPAYLSQVVRAATGAGALAYINRHLAAKVAGMLDMTDLTIQQIADAAGFADQASLSKFFRRMKGMTPSEWRKK